MEARGLQRLAQLSAMRGLQFRQSLIACIACRDMRIDAVADEIVGHTQEILDQDVLGADYRRREGQAPAVVGGSSFTMRLAELPFEGEPRSDASAKPENAVGRAMAIVQREVEPKTWQAFWMCVVDQLSTEEVAKLLEMTPANVRQCRSRVLRRLRQSMASSEFLSLFPSV
jgi:Sigma-70, region 4